MKEYFKKFTKFKFSLKILLEYQNMTEARETMIPDRIQVWI